MTDPIAAARLLSTTHSGRTQIAALPAPLRPDTVADGYAIQHAWHRLDEMPLGPWKAGATSLVAQELLGIDAPFIGRPPADAVLPSGIQISLAERFVGRAGIEVEVGLIAHHDLVAIPDDPLDLAESVDVVPCFEIVNSRFTDITAVGAPSLIADNAIAAMIVCAEPLRLGTDEIRRLDELPVALDVDGDERVAATGAMALGHPLSVLHVVATMAIGWGTPIRAGELVITGTCTGIVAPHSGMTIVGRFGDEVVTASFTD